MTAGEEPRRDGRVARRQGTREVIMTAAIELFAERGVTSTSTDDIAAKAGIAKGSIYYNFASKAGLVEAIMEQNSRLMADSLTAGTRGLRGRELRAAVVRVLLRLVHEHSFAARMMVAELFRTERSWRESIRVWREIALSPLIDDLQSERGDDSRPAASLQAAAIVGATLVTGLEWLVFSPEHSFDEVVAAVLETLGLRGPAGGDAQERWTPPRHA